MSIKYALIDDEPAFYHLFVDLVKEKIDEDELVFFNQSEEFLKCVNGEHYDVIFMDIDMPGMDGISIAKELYAQNIDSVIIFLTNRTDLVYEAFGLNVYRFISKDELSSKKDRLFEDLKKEIVSRRRIVIQNDYCNYRIHQNEIIYAEKIDRSVIIYTKNRQITLKKYNLEQLYELLNHSDYQYANRSVIVNLNYVQKIKRDYVELMVVNKNIDISRGRYQCLLDEFRRIMGS